MLTSKLALGTVQFGLEYGIANEVGKITMSEASKILRNANESKIDMLDTAIAYGDSENVLGKIGVNNFNIVSKLSLPLENYINIGSWVEEQVKASLGRLGIPSLYGLLIHRSQNLLGKSSKDLINALNLIKESGRVKKIGLSIYDPSELDQVNQILKLDIVQAPLNIIDRRLEQSGWLSRLHEEGVEVHTRSVFLQGILLMQRNKIPLKFERWSDIWNQWNKELKKNHLSAVDACLSYPLSMSNVDRVVVGVDNEEQLKMLIAASQTDAAQHDWSFMKSNDQMLINPSNWSAL